MRRLAFLLPGLAALALQLAASRAPERVENAYSRAVYPALAGTIAALTQRAGVVIAEPALLVALAALLGLVLRGLRRRRVGAVLRQLACLAGAGYLAFLLVWGLNYRRRPFAASSGLDVRPVSVDELAALARELASEANAERAQCAEDAAGVFRLAAGHDDALRAAPLGNAALAPLYPALAGPRPAPRIPLVARAMPHVGIAGIYFPFTAEPLVDGSMPDAELPFSASHEIGHAQGIAREDEANFVGYLACRLHPRADFRYSGALVAGFYALHALRGVARDEALSIEATRSPAVLRDVAAIVAWNARFEGPVRDAGERVNDAYLRSQGAREGVRSYGRMVDLLVAFARTHRERVLGSAP